MKLEFRFNNILVVLIIIISICSINSFAQESVESNGTMNSLSISDSNDSQKIYYDIAWEKEFPSGIFSVDISSDGKVISANSFKKIILNSNGEEIWSEGMKLGNGTKNSDISMSPEGNCLSFFTYSELFLYPDYLDKPLWLLKENNTYIYSADVSSNCSLISVINYKGKVYLLNKKGEELWNYQFFIGKNNKYFQGSIVISTDGNYIAVNEFNDQQNIYLFNKEGTLLWKKTVGYGFSPISISSNGNYLLAFSNNEIYLINTTDGIILNKYNYKNVLSGTLQGSVTDSGSMIIFSKNSNQDKKGSSLYVVNSLGNILWKREFDKEISALSISSNGSDIILGDRNGVLSYLYNEKPVHPMNLTFIIIGFMAFGLISLLITLPYYKRAKIKKEMAKTPTDWCPICHKFTGGAAICPHCHHKMLVEVKYDANKKVKKK